MMPERNIDERVKESRRLFWLKFEGKVSLTEMQIAIKEIWDRQMSFKDMEKEKETVQA